MDGGKERVMPQHIERKEIEIVPDEGPEHALTIVLQEQRGPFPLFEAHAYMRHPEHKDIEVTLDEELARDLLAAATRGSRTSEGSVAAGQVWVVDRGPRVYLRVEGNTPADTATIHVPPDPFAKALEEVVEGAKRRRSREQTYWAIKDGEREMRFGQSQQFIPPGPKRGPIPFYERPWTMDPNFKPKPLQSFDQE